MTTPAVRVQERGQVTIPKEIRKRLDLKKGDLVTFIETENGVIIKPAELVVSAALDEIGEALKKRGIDFEELMDRGREVRSQLLEEEHGIKDSGLG